MKELMLHDIAHGRSGDKGDTVNICVFAREPIYYEVIKEQITKEKVRKFFGNMVKGEITRYDVPSLKGFNFVMTQCSWRRCNTFITFGCFGKNHMHPQ